MSFLHCNKGQKNTRKVHSFQSILSSKHKLNVPIHVASMTPCTYFRTGFLSAANGTGTMKTVNFDVVDHQQARIVSKQ